MITTALLALVTFVSLLPFAATAAARRLRKDNHR